MDARAIVTAPLLPGMIVRLMRVAAINMGKDAALKGALLPKIAEFRRTGNIGLFIEVADEVLGLDWLDVGFAHATQTQYDDRIRAVVATSRGRRSE